MLLCDIVGRTIRYPYEVPVSMVMGVVGATFFLGMLLHRRRTGAL